MKKAIILTLVLIISLVLFPLVADATSDPTSGQSAVPNVDETPYPYPPAVTPLPLISLPIILR